MGRFPGESGADYFGGGGESPRGIDAVCSRHGSATPFRPVQRPTRMKLLEIPPLRCADMPERKLGFWKMTGPGAVMVGIAIGTCRRRYSPNRSTSSWSSSVRQPASASRSTPWGRRWPSGSAGAGRIGDVESGRLRGAGNCARQQRLRLPRASRNGPAFDPAGRGASRKVIIQNRRKPRCRSA